MMGIEGIMVVSGADFVSEVCEVKALEFHPAHDIQPIDRYTQNHSSDVTALYVPIAEHNGNGYGLSVGTLKFIGNIHDIGKVTIPPEVLNRSNKGEFISGDMEAMRPHVIGTYDTLKRISEDPDFVSYPAKRELLDIAMDVSSGHHRYEKENPYPERMPKRRSNIPRGDMKGLREDLAIADCLSGFKRKNGRIKKGTDVIETLIEYRPKLKRKIEKMVSDGFLQGLVNEHFEGGVIG